MIPGIGISLHLDMSDFEASFRRAAENFKAFARAYLRCCKTYGAFHRATKKPKGSWNYRRSRHPIRGPQFKEAIHAAS